MLIYLIRHGATRENGEKRVMGRSRSPLTAEGRAMVDSLACALEPERIPVVYTSAVARAVETAAILAGRWRAEVIEEPALSESPYERWVGKTYDELRGDREFELYMTTPTKSSFSAAENMAGIQERALAAVRRIVEEKRAEKAAAISHADVIKPVLAHYLGMDLDAMHRLSIANASVTLLDLDGGVPRLRYVNLAPWKW